MSARPSLRRAVGWLLSVSTVVALAACSSDSDSGPSACTADGSLAAMLRDQLLAGEPGVGRADYPGDPIADVPKATAVMLMAEVMCAAASDDHDRAVMEDLGRRLASWPERFAGDRYGWGLPFEWDAFGDGSTNPADTVYSISTGLAVRALLDWAEVGGDDVEAIVDPVVDLALNEWLEPSARVSSGQLAYSLDANDAGYEVFNSSAMLAGQMQRFAATGRAAREDELRTTADEVMRSLIDHHQVDPAGNWYWHYSTVEPVANDLTHAGYIIDGLLTYSAADGTYASEVRPPLLLEHMLAFRSDGSIPELLLPWPIWRSDELDQPHYRLLRLYEEGWALFMATRSETVGDALLEPLCTTSLRHRDAQGRFHKYALDVDIGDVPNPEIYEYVAYYYLGLVAAGDRACVA